MTPIGPRRAEAMACVASLLMTAVLGRNLRCWQCHPLDSHATDIDRIRITLSLPRPKCFRQVTVTCADNEDVCIRQVARTDQGYFLLMGCSQRFIYESMGFGCSSGKTSQRVDISAQPSAARGRPLNRIRESTIPLDSCICDSPLCNSDSSSRRFSLTLAQLTFLITLVTCFSLR